MIHEMIPTTRHGDVTFHADGRIDITAHATDSTPCEHYLYVARRQAHILGRHACTCRPAKGHGRYLRVHSKKLATRMLDICHATERIELYVGEAVHVGQIGLALPLITAPYQQPLFIDPEQ